MPLHYRYKLALCATHLAKSPLSQVSIYTLQLLSNSVLLTCGQLNCVFTFIRVKRKSTWKFQLFPPPSLCVFRTTHTLQTGHTGAILFTSLNTAPCLLLYCTEVSCECSNGVHCLLLIHFLIFPSCMSQFNSRVFQMEQVFKLILFLCCLKKNHIHW